MESDIPYEILIPYEVPVPVPVHDPDLIAEIDRLRAELAAHVNENEALGKQQGEFIETIVKLEKQRDEALQAKSWQPIETAPRDGTYVLLWDDVNECVYSACWVEDPGMNSPNGYEPASSYWATDHLGWGNDGSNPRWWMPHPEDPPHTPEKPDNMNEEKPDA